jgi:hypothetical protein
MAVHRGSRGGPDEGSVGVRTHKKAEGKGWGLLPILERSSVCDAKVLSRPALVICQAKSLVNWQTDASEVVSYDYLSLSDLPRFTQTYPDLPKVFRKVECIK